MREILFKAKRIDNGEWVEGFYIAFTGKSFIFMDVAEHYCIHTLRWFEIDPKTLCQFTGLYDKNGNKIWENDIVLAFESVYSTVKFGLYHEASKSERTHQGFYLESMDGYCFHEELGYWAKESVVVGNVFDNPELLQEEADE